MKIKECTKCHQSKSLDKFYIEKRFKDGYTSECKLCHNKRAKELRAERNPNYKPVVLQRDKPIKYCIDCENQLIPDDNWLKGSYHNGQYICRDCIEMRTVKWRRANPEKVKEQNKRADNTEKGKISNRKALAKRQRKLNWISMFENPFDKSVEIDWHHITDAYVVAIPRDIHTLYTGFKEHRELVMNIAKQIYLEDD